MISFQVQGARGALGRFAAFQVQSAFGAFQIPGLRFKVPGLVSGIVLFLWGL
jgi:hypothetical protein